SGCTCDDDGTGTVLVSSSMAVGQTDLGALVMTMALVLYW
ncbi:hypothetical protein GBAR_LOCUS17157, partial [Geodia barretti]